MIDHSSASDEQCSAQARIVVSLSYVQTLRRELESGQFSLSRMEEYLARLEGHLREVECSPALAAPQQFEVHSSVAAIADDMLISEHVARN